MPIPLPRHLRVLEYGFEHGYGIGLLSRIVPSSSVHLKLSDDAGHLTDRCRLSLKNWTIAVGRPVRASLQVGDREDLGPDTFQTRLDLWETCEEGNEEVRPPNISFRSKLEPNKDDRLLLDKDLDYSHLHTLELRATISYDLFFALSEQLDDLRLPRLRTLIIREDVPSQPENEHDHCRIYYIHDILRYRFDQDGPLDTLLTSEYIVAALNELGSAPQPPHAGQAGHRALIAYDSDSMPPLSLKDLVSNVSIIADAD
ncbi:hypothetical protein PENSPDRAFT_754030 [Peniophora sp. CONT]|nr:hypothetical protein PENSPDRAFT_754030 [Peniophora sp. CONT]